MYRDYCYYILSKDLDARCTSYVDYTNNICITKEMFYAIVDKAFEVRVEELGIHKNKFNPDYYLFDVLFIFFSDKVIFQSHEAIPSLREPSERNRKKLLDIYIKWIVNGNKYYLGMYDELFEVISQFMIILENARISLEEKNTDMIEFHTASINIQKLSKYIQEKPKKTDDKKKAINMRSVVKALKKEIDSMVELSKNPMSMLKNPKGLTSDFKPQNYNVELFYFLFILHATYTRNEEIRTGVGHGW